MCKQFKASFDIRAPAIFASAVRGPAATSSNQRKRATAAYKNEAGKARSLQLVKFDNRWWISGLTLEQDPDCKGITRDDVAVMGIMLRALKPIASNLAQRVKVGEFKIAATARQAIQATVLERVVNNPDDVLRLTDIGDKNSKYASLA